MTGNYDAHATAKADEATFTLQAGDPYAPYLVELWAALMGENSAILQTRFGSIKQAHADEMALGNTFGNVQQDKLKPFFAYQTAEKMREQRHIVDAPDSPVKPPDVPRPFIQALNSLREILTHITDGGADTGDHFTAEEQKMVRRARSAVLDAENILDPIEAA